jgi:hypothetical protein
VLTVAIQPPIPSALVKPCVKAAATVPLKSPQNAPWPLVRFQNMPSRKVAKSGPLTKLNTSCNMSLMLL